MEHQAKGAAVVGSVQNILFSSCFASIRELAVVAVFTIVVYDLGLLVDPAPIGPWLKKKLLGQKTNSKHLYHWAMGPSSIVVMYQGYDISGYILYIRKQYAQIMRRHTMDS